MSKYDPAQLLVTPPVDSEDLKGYLDEIYTGYREVCILETAIQMGVFDKLSEPKKMQDICHELGIEEMTGTIFLDALVKMGFLMKIDGDYANTDCAEDLLRTGSDMSQIDNITEYLGNRKHWDNLGGILRDGQPTFTLDELFAKDELEGRMLGSRGGTIPFVLGHILEHVDISEKKSFLSLGSNDVLYAVAAAEYFSGMKGFVVDKEYFRETCQKVIEDYGGNVEMIVRDYVKEGFDKKYDVVFTAFSHAALESMFCEPIASGVEQDGYFIVRRPLPEVSMDPIEDMEENITRFERRPKGSKHHHDDEDGRGYIACMRKNGLYLIDRFAVDDRSEIMIFIKN